MSCNLKIKNSFSIIKYLVIMETYFIIFTCIYLKGSVLVMAIVGVGSPSTVWVLGIDLRSSGLVPRVLTK